MKNISSLNLNILVEKLYIESAVNKIFEGISDFGWIDEIQPSLNPSFEFDGVHEYWVDLTKLEEDEFDFVANYIIEVLPNTNLRGYRDKLQNLKYYEGIVIHCGSDANDFKPQENNLCFMDIPFYEDDQTDNSIYVDGREVYGYIMFLKNQNINENVELIQETEDKSIIKQVIDDLGLTRRLLFTFSTGMAAFIEPITNLLNGSGIHLNKTQVIMLIITSIAILIQDIDTDKAKERLKQEGILKYLDNVVDSITDIKEVLNSILKKVMGITYGLTDVLGFAFIMVPFMKVLNELIVDNGINLESIKQLSVGLLSGILAYTVKNVINKIKKRLN